MTSYQDSVPFVPSSPKLPNISSEAHGGNPNRRTWQDNSDWAGALRRKLDYSINYSGHPHVDDIEELSRELIKVFILALQHSSNKQVWLELVHVLSLAQPYGYFLQSPAMLHYAERLSASYTAKAEMLFDVPVLENLSNVFPTYSRSSSLLDSGTNKAVRFAKKTKRLPDKLKLPSTSFDFKVAESRHFPLPNQNTFTLIRRGDEPSKHFKSQRLTLGTLNKSFGNVVIEKATSESVRKQGISLTAAAADIDFPNLFEKTIDEESVITESIDEDAAIRDHETTKPAEFHSITGREAVELFLKHKHLHKVKFVYLNVAKNKEYRPYDLVSVPRDQLEKEHYIFSSFGVLHVYPDGDQSETLTLAEWNKHAVVFTAARKIPFCKNYLICKMFRRWRSNVKRLNFLRMRKKISCNLIHAVPAFGSALLHIFRLIQELSGVEFLPGKPVEICQYTLAEFDADTKKLKVEANNVLELFFRYAKKVVDITRKNCFNHLKYCEQQAKHVKPLYCKESLYLQRRKREARAKNLAQARRITQLLQPFLTLVDQAISVHMVNLAQAAVTKFVSTVLFISDEVMVDDYEDELFKPPESSVTLKDAQSGEEMSLEIIRPLFGTRFTFNRISHQLEMQPTTFRFREVLTMSVDGVFEILCDRAYSMNCFLTVKSFRRPGSAPPSLTSLGTVRKSEVYEQQSVTSVDSEISAVSNESQDDSSQEGTDNSVKASSSELQTAVMPSAGLTEPEISTTTIVTTKDDAEEAATPNMMMSTTERRTLGLLVGGHGLMGCYNPLDQKKLKERMVEDPEIAYALEQKREIIESALKEITDFCDDHNSWLMDIRKFAWRWREDELQRIKGQPASVIEDKINLIKQWIEQVQNMERHFVTSNKLIYVDCHQPNRYLVPALQQIFDQIIEMVLAEAKELSSTIAAEVKDILKVLHNKDTNMKSFAAYARKVTESYSRKDEITEKVSYARSLYDVIRMTCRQLSPEEEKMDDKAKTSWEAFLFQLKDASSFVTSQKPIIMKQLNDFYNKYCAEAERIAHSVSSGIAIDPKADPAEVIDVIKNNISEFQSTRLKLVEFSFYHESVCGEPYPLDDLKQHADEMADRLDLWQHVNVAANSIAEWKVTPFKKFNAQNALKKVNEWRVKAATLAPNLPPNDPVLATWRQTLHLLSLDFPLLHKLSNVAMRPRHWRAIFNGMGETYEAGWKFTIEELLAYNLSAFSGLIHRVYQTACSEYAMEQLLRTIKKEWDFRQFQLAKHIFVIKGQQNVLSDYYDEAAVKQLDKISEPSMQLKQTRSVMLENDSGTYILVGVEDLQKDLSESHVTLQAMLQSRHAIEVRQDAEIWSDTLQQVGEIIDLWVSCQEKWMYLNRVFHEEEELTKRFPRHREMFDNVDKNYRDFIQAMLEDSKVLSVLSRRHGQPGWRELQGEPLRKHLVSCIREEEEILHEIGYILDDFRTQCPRLYFLSDDDCVRLLGISRQPKSFTPFIKKVFKGVRSIVFSLPEIKDGMESQNTSLGLELHSHKLEATHVVGANQELLAIEPLTANSDATTWITKLQERIEEALVGDLGDAVVAVLTDNSITDVLEEVYEAESLGVGIHSYQFKHWMLKYTNQVVLLADTITWFREVKNILRDGKKKEEFEELKKTTIHKLRQLSHVMQENFSKVGKSAIRLRLQCVVSSLITQTSHHREILRSLDDSSIASVNAYEWQRLFRPTADIVDYRKTEVEKEKSYIVREERILDRNAAVGLCYVENLGHREPYGYEYLALRGINNSGVCVGTLITPVTERMMLDMWMTLRMGQCAGLFGPTGFGKSSMVAQLAYTFGRQFINICCSEQITIETLKRSLYGMVESGAWLCFDQAHRFLPSTLSMLSQHINQIQQAYKIVLESTTTQYTVRGDDGRNRLKRSNSVTTLHDSLKDSAAWRPSVTHDYLKSLTFARFEDYDAQTYLNPPRVAPKPVGSIIFDGKLLRVRKGFGTFFTFTTTEGAYPEIPDLLRLSYRPTCVVAPDVEKLIEIWLHSSGFSDCVSLSKKLALTFKVVNGNADHIGAEGEKVTIQASFTKMAVVDLSIFKTIVTVAASMNNKLRNLHRSRAESVCDPDLPGLTKSASTVSSSASVASRFSRRSEAALSNHNEEAAVVGAIMHILPLKLSTSYSISKLKEVLRNIFPLIGRQLFSDNDARLAVALHNQMTADGLQSSEEWLEKSQQLHTLLKLNQIVLVAGLPGSGKTTLYQTLAKALNHLSNESAIEEILQFANEEQESPGYLPDEQIHFAQSEPSESGETASQGVFETDDVTNKSSTKQNLNEPTFQENPYTRVDVTVLYPNAYDVKELFGFYDKNDKIWKQGLLVKLLKECTVVYKIDAKSKEATEPPNETLRPSAGRATKILSALRTQKIPCLRKWLVMDGDPLSSWVDNISCLLDGHRRASMSNMEEISLPKTTNIVLETADFASASPSIATRCAILHCNSPSNWQNIASCWLDTTHGLYAIAQSTIRTWKELIKQMVPDTLAYLSTRNASIMNQGISCFEREKNRTCYGIHEISSFINILSSCMNAHKLTREAWNRKGPTRPPADQSSYSLTPGPDAPSGSTFSRTSSFTFRASSARSRLDNVPEFHHQKSLNLFGFAFVWAFGGHLIESEMTAFDHFLKNSMKNSWHEVIPFPEYETVFDYFVDEESGQFTLWEDKIDLRSKTSLPDPSYVSLHQFERYAHIASVLLKSQKSVLFMGQPGCGKTSLVKNLLIANMDITKIAISPGLSPAHFQHLIEAKASPTMKQHNLGLMAHPSSIIAPAPDDPHHSLFFLDDLSCAGVGYSASDRSKATQPLIELLRQMICLGGVYENERLLFKSLERDLAFIGTSGLPGHCGEGLGYNRHVLSSRLTRNFTVLHFQKPTKESILSIYHHDIQSWLEEFPAYSLTRHYELSQAIISSSYDLYNLVCSHLKSSPRNPHYVFSWHDINNLIQGLFILQPTSRGRPIPLRRTNLGGNVKRSRGRRTLGARPLPRGLMFSDVNENDVPPMMRTMARLWLHEASRVFLDRLTDNIDRNWFSHAVHGIFVNNFCTGKSSRPSTPAMDRVQIVKTPIPSGVAAPVPLTPISGSGTSNTSKVTNNTDKSDNTEQQSQTESDGGIGADADSLAYAATISEGDRTSEMRESGNTSQTEKQSTTDYIDDKSLYASNDQLIFHSSGDNISHQSSSLVSDEKDASSLSASTSRLRSSHPDDDVSGTTTATQAIYDEAETSDGEYLSRATTRATERDESQSAVTGCTTEVESVFGSESIANDETQTSGATSAMKSSDHEGDGEEMQDDVMVPSAGISLLMSRHSEGVTRRSRPTKGSRFSRPGGAKLGVSFVPGLVDDSVEATDHVVGPLIPLDAALDENEDVTSILFSKGILSAAHQHEVGSTDVYTESSQEQLVEAFKICLENYNKEMDEEGRLDLVFFGQVVRHAARLSRIMSLFNGGHALLLSSSSFTGRSSLTKLIAYLNGAKLYSVSPPTGQSQLASRNDLRNVIKEASMDAGVNLKKVVLMVNADVLKEEDCIDDICALAREGQCPALYTYKELANIAATFGPATSVAFGGVKSDFNFQSGKITSTEKLEQTLQVYFANVISNIHIVVMTSYPRLQDPHNMSQLHDNSDEGAFYHKNGDLERFNRFLRRSPDLLTRFCCIDLYRDWDHISWQMLALHYLEESASRRTASNLIKIPWSDEASASVQIERISHLMAHIHQDARLRAKASLSHGADKLIGPLALRQVVQLFVGISTSIKRKEMVILKKCSEALFKAQQAQFSLQQYEHDREMKIPQLAHAREMEKILKKQVEDARQDYADARQKCVLEEENIENLENEVETLRIENKAAFHETNPMFTAAHTAAEALTDKCLDELRRYAHPPKSAVTVLTCLCHMFQISPANWENGRALISKENFFMELEFFDKINMPENVFQTLESYALSPDFQIEKVEKSSFAVAKLCIWIHAIYNYGKEHRILQPKLDAQKEAERKLYEAEATLGLKRVKCNQIKDNLDSKIKEHKLATLKIKQMEKELKFLESKIGRAQNLTENLKEYVGSWSDKRELVKMRLSAAIGDGVLTAACVAYYGSFVFEQREQALRQWKKAAEQGYIDNKSGVFKVDNDYYTMAISRRRIVESSSSTKIKVDSEMSWHEGEAEEASARSSFSQHNKVNAFVKTRENFHLNDILTDASEVREWHRFALPRDDHARFDALRLHSLNLHQDLSWSFIFDPDDQAKKWLDVIVPKLLKDFQNPNLSQDTISNPPRQMSASTNQESFAIYDEEDGRKSSPLTSQSEHTRTGSGMSTEITISVSATTTVVTEKVISSHSTQDEDKHGGDEERCDETNHDTEENKKSSISVKEDTDATTTETEEDGKDGGRKDADVDKETQNFVSPDHKGKVDTTKTPSFPYPLTQLWVCTAVDSRMPSLLHSAISYGALLLVTNIEQASKTNSDILLKISFLSLKNSWRIFHRNFRLFLTTSVSIRTVFHNEKTRLFLPMHRFSIIDMSLNKNVLEEQLESIVLGQERPEFEAQRRLMEADVFHLEERLEILRDDLIQKITSISESLLVNPYIMADIHATRQEMEVVSNSLKESRMMEHNHVQKKADLSKVAGHGRMLFKCVEWTSSLNISLYHLSASKFIKIFQGCLLNHKRGRGSVSMGAMGIGSKGLMKSRVVELKQSLTDVMLRYVRRRFFQSDVVVFTTFVSLNQLVENEKMTKEEMEEFLEVSDRSETNRDKSPRTRIFMSDMLAIERPDWMSVAQWDDVTSLEQRYPDTYATVAYSIASKPKRWIEFLNASPILLAEFPCMKLRKLQLGQKALLWKTLRPDKFNEIASDLNACVIGGSVTTSYTFDLEIVVPDLSFQTPCVFVLPSQYNESCFIPSHHVNSVAKTVGATVMERSALFEGDISDALEQCMINGRWFVLNDCHLVHHWPKKFLQLLTNLQSIDPNSDHLYNLEQERREFQQLSKNSSKYSTYSFLGSHLKSDRDLIDVLLANLQITPSSPNMCHPDFRLFMVTKENKVSNLPGAVTQHAEFLVIETSSSYKDLVQKAYRTLMRAAKQVIKPASHVSATSGPSFMNRIAVPYNVQASNQEVIRLSREQQEMILQLSLLHATLLERITFKEIAFATTCLWTDGELLDALNALLLTQNPSIASTLCSNIILRHVTESMDKEIVREIIEKCFAPVANVGDNSNMFANLVLLLRSGETIQHIFNKLLQKPDLKKLGLQPTSGNENIRIHGTTLSDALRKTCSFNVIQWGKNPLLDNSLIMSAREISLRRSLESMFFELMEIPKAKLNKQITSSVMKDFYAAEVKRLNTVIDVTRHDIGLSLGAVKSNNELTVDLLCILERMAVNKLPMQWLTYHQELFRFHSFQSLSDFIQHLGRRVKLITSYMSAAAEEPQISTEDKDGTPPDMPNSSQSFKSVLNINLRSNLLRDVFAYNLAAFTRPDMFLQSVLFAVARSRHHDAHKYSFTTEIVADIGSYKPLPNNSSFDSIYLDGLRLHKAMYDPKGQVLLEAFSSEPCPMPMLRLTAVKSTARSNESFVARNNVYDCPVWINEQESPSMCLDSNVVIKVPLATNKPKERWFTRGVTITAFLGKD